jgi:hypothetical protein
MKVNFLNRGDVTVLSIGMIFSKSAWANSPRISTKFLQGERFRTSLSTKVSLVRPQLGRGGQTEKNTYHGTEDSVRVP